MKTKIIAHRGSSFTAPENTLAAFKLGIDQNADGIEGDFRLTKDGYIVCMHDLSAKRTTGVERNIEESTLEEIRKLDAGVWKGDKWKNEKIPLLSEILDILPHDKKIYIEIKSDTKIVPYMKLLLADSKINSCNIYFIAFNKDIIELVKKEMPHYKAFWLTNFKNEKGEFLNHEEILNILKEIKADGIDCEANEYVDEIFIEKLRKDNMELHCWTVDDLEKAKRFKKFGFDSITTNKPDLLLNSL